MSTSVFPFTSHAEDTVKDDKKLPVFKEYAYDYENNCLKTRGGHTYLVEKDEALKVWLYHALRVARYRYAAHSHEYGNELEELVGTAGNREILESEITRYIKEAVMVCSYIQEISDFSFAWQSGSGCAVSFQVVSIYGRFTHEAEVYNE